MKARWVQGTGRHAKEFVLERMDQQLAVCNALLEESGAFLTGPHVCTADLFLFAIVEGVRCSHSRDALCLPASTRVK